MTRRVQEVWTRLLEEWLIPQSEVCITRARTRIVIVTVPGGGPGGDRGSSWVEASLHVEFYYWVFTVSLTQACLPGLVSGTGIQVSPVLSLCRHWAAALTQLFHMAEKWGSIPVLWGIHTQWHSILLDNLQNTCSLHISKLGIHGKIIWNQASGFFSCPLLFFIPLN